MNRFYFIIIFLFSINVLAQKTDTLKHQYISARFSKGIIYAHHNDFKYFIKDYVSAIELNYAFRSTGKKTWQKIYKYPKTGFGYIYINLGNPEILGTAQAFFTYIKFPFIEKNNYLFSSKFAAGIGYLNKAFDLYNNKYNIAIGAHINAYFNINLDLDILIYKQLHLTTGIGLSHFSNGATTKPNKGINVVLPSIGLSYSLQKQKFIKNELAIPEFKKNYELSVIYAAGYNAIEPANPQKYFASSFSLNLVRQFSYKGAFGIGMDFFYDASIPEYEYINDTIVNHSFFGKTSSGLHFSYDFVFGKSSFTIQFGGYFYKGNNFEEYVYHRFGVKYHFTEHWIANLSLKSFWAKAKYPELGIGYRFSLKN